MNLSPHRRIWLAATVLLIPGWASASHAEEEPKPPVSARALAETPFQLVLPRAHLAGDWFGVRTWLEDHGVNPTLTFVTDALGNPSGGVQHGFTAANNLGVDLLFDLHKLVGIDGGWFEVSFSERFGSSLSKDDIGNVFTVQQVFGGETYRIVDVAYRQRLFGDRVEFRVGRIAAGDDFLVSPYDYVFVQNGFDGNPVGVFFNAQLASRGGLVVERSALRDWRGRVPGRRPARESRSARQLQGGILVRPQPVHRLQHAGARAVPRHLSRQLGCLRAVRPGVGAVRRTRQQPRLRSHWISSRLSGPIGEQDAVLRHRGPPRARPVPLARDGRGRLRRRLRSVQQ
ncbi:MAG: carbohydrate porin [Deltaproteobacteria bacterium]|nr:MAG: carbohydrate porin [Deltaproteobacteria bacterium]